MSDTICAEFYCGNYSEVLRELGRASLFGKVNEHLWAFQVGALIFVGDVFEAESIYNLARRQEKLSADALAQARFFIGVGLVRTSRYKEARSYFAKNLFSYWREKRLRSHTPARAFYAYQGAAFFYFFHARFKNSLAMAQKAYRHAFEYEFLFGQAFAAELMGHCNCQLGEVHRGLADFKKAIACADTIGNGGLASAFKIAYEKFRSQYGLEFKNTHKTLARALKTLSPEDTYSRAELYLEMSRYLVQMGRASEARNLLDDNAESIYRYQNRRQSATFNLRYAYLLYLRGENQAALTLLRSSRGNLVAAVDRLYLCQLAGLEEKILRSLKNFRDDSTVNPKGSSKGEKFINFVDARIAQRQGSVKVLTLRTGEDAVGDLLDGCANGSVDLPTLLKSGFWGFVPTVLKQEFSTNFIYLGPTRAQLVLYSQGDVHFAAEGFTKPMQKILQLLEGGTLASKEWLVTNVWNYEYRPERHDSLLHATIGKLRKLLGPFNEWIEWDSGGYRLRHGIKILSSQPQSTSTTPAPLVASLRFSDSELNYRQLQLVKLLGDGRFIGVTAYARQFKVCKMTACRDLTSLCKQNILNKVGRARATQYELRGSHDVRNQSQKNS